MIRTCKFLVASAFLLGAFAAGNASTLTLGSYATTAANPGFDNGSTSYVNGSSTVDTGTTATYDVDAGSVWHAPLGLSSYVSFNAGTGANLTYVAPNGDYIYTTTFATPSKSSEGPYTGSLTVLADDTLSVYLNGTMLLAASGPMGSSDPYDHCADSGPNCMTPFTFSFTGVLDGTNVLTFDVKQVHGYQEGLDYTGTVVSTVPEPSSLALMGTGMATFAGLVRRRFSK